MNEEKMTVKENRIDTLDCFRFIAILSVMLFHYYSRYTTQKCETSLYPYNSKYDYFEYGYLGVQFFFIISGFVIAFTLTRTSSFINFWKKRIIRLLPSLLICSLVTLFVIRLIDKDNIFQDSHSFKNIIYSLTLLSPELLNKIFSFTSVHGSYINGSYWSLWPEIQFYLVASFIYFINRKHFVRNFTLFNLVLFLFKHLIFKVMDDFQIANALHLNINNLTIENLKYWINDIFNYVNYSLYFVSGVLFYQLYSKEDIRKSIIFLSITIFMLLYFGGGFTFNEFLPIHSVYLMVLFFIGFIYYSKHLKILNLKPITNIGAASYSLYLIHEVIGVLLINKFATIFGKYDYIFPIIVIFIMICFALFSFKFIEKPIGRYLKMKLIN